MIKTAFFSSDAIAIPSIEFLHANADFPLACVVSNPDRPKGRGNRLSPNDVSAWALANNVPLLRPEKRDDALLADRLRAMGVEMVVVMAYGKMLGREIYEYGKYPCLNLHASVLPELRGASPVETAVALGKSFTGVSLMRIVRAMDAGDVCAVLKTPIDGSDTGGVLRKKISLVARDLLAQNISGVADGTAVFVPQDSSKATYTRKFDKRDLYIDFNLPAEDVCRRIRAFGAGIFTNGADTIKVGSAFAAGSCNARAGEVLRADGGKLVVACKGGAVEFTSLQKPCAKMMPVSDFLRGYNFKVGSLLSGAESKPLLK